MKQEHDDGLGILALDRGVGERASRKIRTRRPSAPVFCFTLAVLTPACGSDPETPGYGTAGGTTTAANQSTTGLPTTTGSVGSTTSSVSSTGVGGATSTAQVTATASVTGGTTTGGTSTANQEKTPPAVPYQLCQVSMACQGPIPDDRETDERVNCSFEVIEAPGIVEYTGYAGVKVRGRSSREYPKQNYSVELWDQAGLEVSAGLLGMGGEADWVLDGLWLDRSLMRNSLVYDLFRGIGIGRYASKGRFCTLTLNGSAQGIYRLGERVKRDDDRLVLLEDDGTGSSFVIKQHMNGVLRMPVQPSGGFNGGGNGDETNWEMIYPNQSSATPAQVAGVQAFLDGLLDARENDPNAIFTGYLDVDATADWILTNEFAKNIDGFHLSIHMFRDLGGLAGFVPWDFDLSMGQPTVEDDDTNQDPEGWVINHSQYLEQLLEAPALSGRLASRWAELRQGPFSTARVGAWMDSYSATLVATEVANNFAIWPIEDIEFEQIYPAYTLYDVTSHAEEVARLKSWLEARLSWMDGNVANYPN